MTKVQRLLGLEEAVGQVFCRRVSGAVTSYLGIYQAYIFAVLPESLLLLHIHINCINIPRLARCTPLRSLA